MRSSSRKKSAFTLIELLVVIAIIAILAAIFFPVFAQSRANENQPGMPVSTDATQLGLLLAGSHPAASPLMGADRLAAAATAAGRYTGPDVSFDNKHYGVLFITGGITWGAANDRAQGLYFQDSKGKKWYGHLFTSNTLSENSNVFAGLGRPTGCWMGGYQQQPARLPYQGWHWVTGSTWSFTNWASKQPDDGHGFEDGSQDHLRFAENSNGLWDDASGNQRGFVIEFEP